MRKQILIVFALVLVAGSVFIAKYLIDNKEKPKSRSSKIVKTVFTETVVNKSIPLLIRTNGNLVAKNKIDIFSEVQGVLMPINKEFKSGTSFNKGETFIKINSDEYRANLKSQKSSLYNLLTSIMPDIRLDFSEEYDKWQEYLHSFDINKPIKDLPKTLSDKEKYFISGRGILTSFYNVKNMEVKLSKYNLKAPFSGILTESLVNFGTLVRPGQKLGEFIDPSVYEIAVSVKSEFRNLLEIGKNVEVFNLEKTISWIGKVVRINGKVDLSTQTIKAFIQVKGDDLKEGQYLEVILEGKSEENVYEVARNLLIDESKLFFVKDSVLVLADVNLVFENKNTVIIRGLKDGTQILSKPIPGAHQDMLVKVFDNNTEK